MVQCREQIKHLYRKAKDLYRTALSLYRKAKDLDSGSGIAPSARPSYEELDKVRGITPSMQPGIFHNVLCNWRVLL